MQSAAKKDFLGFALVFFNMKQYSLWFVQAIAMNKQYPDPVLQLVTYIEVLHCFKSTLLMYRVFDALFKCESNHSTKGQVTKQRMVYAALLLSSGGALLAYLAAELSRKKRISQFPSVSFVVPLMLVAGVEVLVDLYLLVCINAELQGKTNPLRESLLGVTGESGGNAKDGDEDQGEDGMAAKIEEEDNETDGPVALQLARQETHASTDGRRGWG
jgi:hypothetical protein